MRDVPQAVMVLADRLSELGWVRDLFVAGSLATGDYVPGVSDLDLVAVVDGPVEGWRLASLIGLHRELDGGIASGLDLGCVYVDDGSLLDRSAHYPMWTHGELVRRSLSGVTRAELARHGFAVIGRTPQEVLPPVTDADVARRARRDLRVLGLRSAPAVDVAEPRLRRISPRYLSHSSRRQMPQPCAASWPNT